MEFATEKKQRMLIEIVDATPESEGDKGCQICLGDSGTRVVMEVQLSSNMVSGRTRDKQIYVVR